MREIKFRAWNCLTKNMIDLQAITPLALDSKLNALGAKGLFIPFDPDLVLMQFTGLTDKNGREIYEGDILKMEEATAKVVFWGKPPAFGLDFSHNENTWNEDWNLSDDSERMVVIGNIYEHSELEGK